MYNSNLVIIIIMSFLLLITVINFIYQNKRYKIYKQNDLKVVHIDLYNSDNRSEYKIDISKMDEIFIKVRENMLFYGISFTISDDTNIATIIEIGKYDVFDIDKYNNYEQLKIVCLDDKERLITIYQ